MIDLSIFASKITRRGWAKLYYGRQILNLRRRLRSVFLSLIKVIALGHLAFLLAFLLAFFNLNRGLDPGNSRWLGDGLLGTGRAMNDPPWPDAIFPGINGWSRIVGFCGIGSRLRYNLSRDFSLGLSWCDLSPV
jgi:hypothetical protein